jgi:hypothetical protein
MYDGRRAPLKRGWTGVVTVASVVFVVSIPQDFSADYNVKPMYYSAVAPACFIIKQSVITFICVSSRKSDRNDVLWPQCVSQDRLSAK